MVRYTEAYESLKSVVKFISWRFFFHRKKVGRTNVWKTRDGVNLMRGRATDSLNGEIAEGFSTENFFMFFQNVEVIPKWEKERRKKKKKSELWSLWILFYIFFLLIVSHAMDYFFCSGADWQARGSDGGAVEPSPLPSPSNPPKLPCLVHPPVQQEMWWSHLEWNGTISNFQDSLDYSSVSLCLKHETNGKYNCFFNITSRSVFRQDFSSAMVVSRSQLIKLFDKLIYILFF